MNSKNGANDWNDEQIKALVEDAVRRSTADPEFRRLLLTDAEAALAMIDCRPLPAHLNLQFVETGVMTRVIVLPDATVASDEMSAEQLDQVAGGGADNGGAEDCNLTL